MNQKNILPFKEDRAVDVKKQYDIELEELVYQTSFYQIIVDMQLELANFRSRKGETEQFKKAKERLDKLKNLAFGFSEFFKQNAENWLRYDFYRIEYCKLFRENEANKKEIEKLMKVINNT